MKGSYASSAPSTNSSELDCTRRMEVYYIEWIGLWEGEYNNSDILRFFSTLDKAKNYLCECVKEDWKNDHRGYEDFNEYLDSGLHDDELVDWTDEHNEYHIYVAQVY